VIRIHHIGGIGGYGPSEVLTQLGHTEWIIYDAQEESLSSASPLGPSRQFVKACVGKDKGTVDFHVTRWPSASSMLKPAASASQFTLILPDDRALVWGPHTEIVKTISMETDGIDSLASDHALPPADFLSVDAQGAELLILEGASKMLKDVTTGVVCEVEFAELYEEQPLFQDTAARLKKDHFRLCEVFNQQYFNTAPAYPSVQGRGFLTVGEALFLRESGFWLGDEEADLKPENVIKCLKLAAVAVAFDQLDYAMDICRRLEKSGLISLSALAEQTNVKYVRLLSDLLRAVDSRGTLKPSLELPEDQQPAQERRTGMPGPAALVFVGVAIQIGARGLIRRTTRKKLTWGYPPVSKVLHKYGFEQLAMKHMIRALNVRLLNGGTNTKNLDFMSDLYRYLISS
jgi:FkbM family methyltransferase